MKLGEFIRLNKQKGVSYSIAVHIFITIMVSFNFDVTVGTRPAKQLVYMDIVENYVGTPVEDKAQTEVEAPLQAVAVPQTQQEAKTAEGSQTGDKNEKQPGEGQTRQAGDPDSEKILWVCGLAAPRLDERGGFSGPWMRNCTVPSAEYFKEWNITRVAVLSAIVGEGSIKINGDTQYERGHANADCERGNFDTKSPAPEFGKSFVVEIPKCEMGGCPLSKCWAILTYYGKTKENKEEAPFLNSWRIATQESPKGPVYLMDPPGRAQSYTQTASISLNVNCSDSGPNQCSLMLIPPGRNIRARVEGTKCENFGGYTSFDDCNENHKPYGCEGKHMGNQPSPMLCWKGLGPARNLTRVPAFALWKKLGWVQDSKTCEDLGGYSDERSCQANAQPNSPCESAEFSAGFKCWRNSGEPLSRDRSPAHAVWKKMGL